MNAWPFDQTPRTAAITDRQVLKEEREICLVLHYSDDHSWAFLSGVSDGDKDGKVICMSEALDMDGTVAEVADLPPGWQAWRERRGAEWQRSKNEKDEG